jgi:uncharacterized membrane protein
MGGYRPTVDPYNDPKPERIARDEHECRQLAKEASGGTAKEAVVGGAVGGLLGAASGAAIGAAFGSPGTGAAAGAAAGGLGGGTYKGLSAEERFKRAFQNCMRNRGHNVID